MAFIRTSKRTAAKNRRKAANYKRVCVEVDERDNGFCVVCCWWTPEPRIHHHIIFRSQGGPDTTENLCTVCATCHADIHDRKVLVTGNANKALHIERKVA